MKTLHMSPCEERPCDTRPASPPIAGRAAIVKQYKPRIEKAKDDEQFFVLMNQMLFQLGTSHLGLIPDEHPEWIGAPAVFADGDVGIMLS